MGAPIGNNNATKNKPWAEALARVNIQSDGAKMRALAEKVWLMALEGNEQAIKEIADRHDGKVSQSVDLGGSVEIKAFGWQK